MPGTIFIRRMLRLIIEIRSSAHAYISSRSLEHSITLPSNQVLIGKSNHAHTYTNHRNYLNNLLRHVVVFFTQINIESTHLLYEKLDFVIKAFLRLLITLFSFNRCSLSFPLSYEIYFLLFYNFLTNFFLSCIIHKCLKNNRIIRLKGITLT